MNNKGWRWGIFPHRRRLRPNLIILFGLRGARVHAQSVVHLSGSRLDGD
jgi:hypothetical protein